VTAAGLRRSSQVPVANGHRESAAPAGSGTPVAAAGRASAAAARRTGSWLHVTPAMSPPDAALTPYRALSPAAGLGTRRQEVPSQCTISGRGPVRRV
jgi:hypothetical protein